VSTDEDPAAWLRSAITERLELAREAATPGDLRGTGARLGGMGSYALISSATVTTISAS
jgi:hypothetical protein